MTIRKPPLWNRSAAEFAVDCFHHFGPYASWGNKTFPEGRADEYRKMCADLAGAIGCEPRGVEALLNMMVFGGWNTQKNLKLRIWAWARALEIGFMTEAEIPLFSTEPDEEAA